MYEIHLDHGHDHLILLLKLIYFLMIKIELLINNIF